VNTPTGHAKPGGGAPFLARAPPALQAISASAVCFLIITQWRMLPRLATAGWTVWFFSPEMISSGLRLGLPVSTFASVHGFRQGQHAPERRRVDRYCCRHHAARGEYLREQAAERMPDDRRHVGQAGDYFADVVRHLAD
jgi:hypothetical protein